MRCEPIGSRYFLSHALPLDEDLRRALLRSDRLDDDVLREAGDAVRLLAEVLAFHDVAEGDVAADLRQDRGREGIPLDELLARHDFLSVGHLDRRAVNDGVPLLLAPLVVHDRDLAVAVDHDEVAVLALNRRRPKEPDRARVLGGVLGLLGDTRRGATVVERPHRELGAGLADRLRRDDAARLRRSRPSFRRRACGRSRGGRCRAWSRRSAPSGS